MHGPNVHRMTLREPWQRKPCGDCIEFQRAFHRPTNLNAQERVFVAVRAASADGTVKVNGKTLGELTIGMDGAFEVTELLEPRNHISISMPAATNTADLPFAETAIEIRQRNDEAL